MAGVRLIIQFTAESAEIADKAIEARSSAAKRPHKSPAACSSRSSAVHCVPSSTCCSNTGRARKPWRCTRRPWLATRPAQRPASPASAKTTSTTSPVERHQTQDARRAEHPPRLRRRRAARGRSDRPVSLAGGRRPRRSSPVGRRPERAYPRDARSRTRDRAAIHAATRPAADHRLRQPAASFAARGTSISAATAAATSPCSSCARRPRRRARHPRSQHAQRQRGIVALDWWYPVRGRPPARLRHLGRRHRAEHAARPGCRYARASPGRRHPAHARGQPRLAARRQRLLLHALPPARQVPDGRGDVPPPRLLSPAGCRLACRRRSLRRRPRPRRLAVRQSVAQRPLAGRRGLPGLGAQRGVPARSPEPRAGFVAVHAGVDGARHAPISPAIGCCPHQ